MTSTVSATDHVRAGELAPQATSTLQRLREVQWERKSWPDPINQTEQYSYECPVCKQEKHIGHSADCTIGFLISEYKRRGIE